MVSLLGVSGCPSTLGCDPPSEPFDLDEPVTAAEIDELIEAGYYGQTDWASVECETVCSRTYTDVRGWEASGIDSCTLELPENPDGSGAAGRVTCSGTGYEYLCEGRRPLGHVEAGAEVRGDGLGRTLAAMAHLERASVVAFEQLAAWLAGRGAPVELVERCREAADDERHHARWLTRLAEERGAGVPAIATNETGEASVLDVALHNAVEGCVHESFAALMAAVRSTSAADPRLRRVFAKIAADETRHGQLAWDLDAWLHERLEPAELQLVELRRREALERLPARARALQSSMPASLGRLDGDRAERLASCFAARLAA